jgi:hypothetical protein
MYSTGFTVEFKVSWTEPFFSFLFAFLQARLFKIFGGVTDCEKMFLLNIGLLVLLLPLLFNTIFPTISTPRRQMVGHPLLVNNAFQDDCI